MTAKILIVDDATLTRKLLSDILKQEGYEIVGEAENNKEAVDKFHTFKPDLVMMDILMPDENDIDGVGVIRHIIKNDKDAKIVMISALGQHSLVVESIQAGAQDFIVKPFNPSLILDTVRRVLG